MKSASVSKPEEDADILALPPPVPDGATPLEAARLWRPFFEDGIAKTWDQYYATS